MNKIKQMLNNILNGSNIELRERPSADLRNYEVSSWHDISLEKATDEGFLSNVNVFVSVNLRSQLVSSVPFHIINTDTGEPIENHDLTPLLTRPNTQHSFSEILKFIMQWYDLVGDAYIYKSMLGDNTEELWPISPVEVDVMQKPNGVPGEIIYLKKGTTNPHSTYNVENMMRFYYPNPANLVTGISPLEVIGGTVDIATKTQEYNEAMIDKKGTLDYVIQYDKQLSAPAATAQQKRNDQFLSGKHTSSNIGMIDAGGKLIPLGKTGEELGFRETEILGRDKIFNAYGGTPQIFGYDVASYAAQRDLVRWYGESTIVPLAQQIASIMTRGWEKELGENEKVVPNLNDVKFLRATESEKIVSAEKLYNMGIPVSQISDRYQLGVEAYPGWDEPFNGQSKAPTQEIRIKKNEPVSEHHCDECEAIDTRQLNNTEKDAFEEDSAKIADNIRIFLKKERVAVIKAIEGGASVQTVLNEATKRQTDKLNDIYINQAVKYGLKTTNSLERSSEPVVHTRASLIQEVTESISQFIVDEKVSTLTSALISETTQGSVTKLLDKALSEEWGITKIRDSFVEMPDFSAARALTIARTVNGTARSMGQFTAAKMSGATQKRWDSSEDRLVRHPHVQFDRDGYIPIDDVWTFEGKSLRFPGDMKGGASLIVNCRCAMSFK